MTLQQQFQGRSQTAPSAQPSLDPRTRVGAVHLTVNDLDLALSFYQNALGLQLLDRRQDLASLGAAGHEVLRLFGDPAAPRLRRSTGLYHFALLLPDRQALGRSLYRLAATQTPLQGAADHWFSEAIYLADPEGNGIELYRDRPRHEWPPMEEVASRGNGHFDLRRLLDEVASPPQPGDFIDPGVRLGHMHLRVADIPSADQFYINTLGFDLVMRYGSAAGFVSAGGYHHHIAYNTWQSAGAPAMPPGAAGLRAYTIVLPDSAALEAVRLRLDQAGLSPQPTNDGLFVRDPAGLGILLHA